MLARLFFINATATTMSEKVIIFGKDL